jgi:hypothetical protein
MTSTEPYDPDQDEGLPDQPPDTGPMPEPDEDEPERPQPPPGRAPRQV